MTSTSKKGGAKALPATASQGITIEAAQIMLDRMGHLIVCETQRPGSVSPELVAWRKAVNAMLDKAAFRYRTSHMILYKRSLNYGDGNRVFSWRALTGPGWSRAPMQHAYASALAQFAAQIRPEDCPPYPGHS
jgi:hypothetical protein